MIDTAASNSFPPHFLKALHFTPSHPAVDIGENLNCVRIVAAHKTLILVFFLQLNL